MYERRVVSDDVAEEGLPRGMQSRRNHIATVSDGVAAQRLLELDVTHQLKIQIVQFLA